MAAKVAEHGQTTPAVAPASTLASATPGEVPPFRAPNEQSTSPSDLLAHAASADHHAQDQSTLNETALANDEADAVPTDKSINHDATAASSAKPSDTPSGAVLDAPLDAPGDTAVTAAVATQAHKPSDETADHADNKPAATIPVVPLPPNGNASSGEDDKQEEHAPNLQGEEVDATVDGPLTGEKRKADEDLTGANRDATLTKKAKPDTEETAEPTAAMPLPGAIAQAPAAKENGKKRPGRPPKRDQAKAQKNTPAPVGRTVRKTRSQGPVGEA